MKYFTVKEMGTDPPETLLMKFCIVQVEAKDRSGAYYGPLFTQHVIYKSLTGFDGKLVTLPRIVEFITLYNQIYTVPVSMKIEGNQFMIWIEH